MECKAFSPRSSQTRNLKRCLLYAIPFSFFSFFRLIHSLLPYKLRYMVYYSLNTWHLVLGKLNSYNISSYVVMWWRFMSKYTDPTSSNQTIYGTLFSLKILCVCHFVLLLLLAAAILFFCSLAKQKERKKEN